MTMLLLPKINLVYVGTAIQSISLVGEMNSDNETLAGNTLKCRSQIY